MLLIFFGGVRAEARVHVESGRLITDPTQKKPFFFSKKNKKKTATPIFFYFDWRSEGSNKTVRLRVGISLIEETRNEEPTATTATTTTTTTTTTTMGRY